MYSNWKHLETHLYTLSNMNILKSILNPWCLGEIPQFPSTMTHAARSRLPLQRELDLLILDVSTCHVGRGQLAGFGFLKMGYTGIPYFIYLLFCSQINMELSWFINSIYVIAGWFIMENPPITLMIWWQPHLGNPQRYPTVFY